MKNSKTPKSSAVIRTLLGVTAMLIVMLGIVGCSNTNQEKQPGKTQASAVSTAANVSGYPDNYQIQFQQDWLVNKDFKGYLTLEGTSLATNVVQGTDNTYYREHGFDGTEGGRIAFLDYRANIETPSKQLVIYLPHANNHIKFGELVKFKNLEYYKEHPVISFNSLHSNAKYKVFAVALFPSGYEGIPYQTCMETNDKAQLVTLVQQALDHSILEIPVDVRDTDELLTVMSEDLSLVDENGKYARIAVFARKIRDGESETVNTQKAVVKPNKHMPQSWYDQILRTQYVETVNQEIRKEAAGWFTAYELSNIADADLERLLTARKADYAKYLNDQEMLLSAEEKAYLYEKRVQLVKNPVLTLDMQTLTTRVGDETTLNAQLAPNDPAAAFTWSSSNKDVVSVAGNGASAKLTARKEGSATITVTSGQLTASCKVDVQPKKSLVLNPTSMTIFVDNSYNIKASTDIQQATSSDTGIAKVSINNNLATVYGVSPGRATITVTGKNGMYATCEVTVKQYSLTFDKTSLTMHKGNRREIHVSTGEAANWYVSNTSVIKLTEIKKGKVALVEAIGPGTATVTATARNGAQVKCDITVEGGGIAFSTRSMDLYKGEFREMTVTRGNVTKWEISDKSVADVCIFSDGKTIEVEALGYGTATIKAYGSDGSYATLTVNVSAHKESLTITPYSMTITQGEMRNISVTSGSASNWVSSNSAVAEVFVVGDGSMAQVEARKPGTATITVYDRQGGWVNCNVTVEAPAEKLVVGPGSVRMNVGDWEQLSVTSGQAIDWSSTDDSVVGVYIVGGDPNNVQIKGNGAGSAQIIGYGVDGSKAVCYVTVDDPYVEPLRLNRSSLSLTEGDMGDLNVSSGSASSWSSSNPAVADVYVVGDGSMVQVEGRSAGTTTITAYANDGSTASCTVSVEAAYVPPVETAEPLTLNTRSISVEEGDWAEIYVSGGRCVDWNTSNQNVVRIYDVGDPTMIKIKGESAGTAEIFAYGADGSTVVCKVTVNAYEEVIPDTEWEAEWDEFWNSEWDAEFEAELEAEYGADWESELEAAWEAEWDVEPEAEPQAEPEPEAESFSGAEPESYDDFADEEAAE